MAADELLSVPKTAREREAFEAALLEAIAALDRGEGMPVTPEYWEQLHARIREYGKNRTPNTEQ